MTSAFSEIVEQCKQLSKAAEFYTGYIEYFFQRKPNESLPILKHFIEKGNTTVYEWRVGVAPAEVEKAAEIPLVFGDEEKEEVSDEIDFGIDVANIDDKIEGLDEVSHFWYKLNNKCYN